VKFPSLALITHLSVAAVAGTVGWQLRDRDYQAHLKEEAEDAVQVIRDVRDVEDRNEKVSQANREELSQKQQQVQVVYRTVTKEIPVYVTHTQFEERVVANGGLPLGFVWSYNQSVASATAPLPPGLNPDTPTGLGMSALAGNAAGNFAMCHAWRAELTQWHSWYNQLEASWPQDEGEDNAE
jgi:hypothetical protein